MQETRHVNYLVLGNLFTNLFQVTLGEDQPHITLSIKNHQSSKDLLQADWGSKLQNTRRESRNLTYMHILAKRKSIIKQLKQSFLD
jgi:hypothetical protein